MSRALTLNLSFPTPAFARSSLVRTSHPSRFPLPSSLCHPRSPFLVHPSPIGFDIYHPVRFLLVAFSFSLSLLGSLFLCSAHVHSTSARGPYELKHSLNILLIMEQKSPVRASDYPYPRGADDVRSPAPYMRKWSC
ncbi:hypothetical protein PENSPDRAFT_649780 [Peniophora sp. CONT]|nr:hypothetical protein PENSPDRAFT_649780 [Peniophora sp. CONT]